MGEMLQHQKNVTQTQEWRSVVLKDGITENQRAAGSPDSDSSVHPAPYLVLNFITMTEFAK